MPLTSPLSIFDADTDGEVDSDLDSSKTQGGSLIIRRERSYEKDENLNQAPTESANEDSRSSAITEVSNAPPPKAHHRRSKSFRSMTADKELKERKMSRDDTSVPFPSFRRKASLSAEITGAPEQAQHGCEGGSGILPQSNCGNKPKISSTHTGSESPSKKDSGTKRKNVLKKESSMQRLQMSIRRRSSSSPSPPQPAPAPSSSSLSNTKIRQKRALKKADITTLLDSTPERIGSTLKLLAKISFPALMTGFSFQSRCEQVVSQV